MSAEKNNQNIPEKKGKRIALWVIIVLLAVVLLAVVLLWWGLYNTNDVEDPAQATVNAQTQPVDQTIGAGNMEDISVELGEGMRLTHIGAYTGAYVEDGTNEIVTDVLMIIVTNEGASAIEYAEITLPAGEETAHFSVSALLSGASVVLLEKDRLPYTGKEAYEQAAADTVAVFQQPLSLHEDKIAMQILNGAINVSNISGEDISGDILIYYKNSAADLYYGGITYRVRIEGGLEAGEVRQIMASHFSPTGSEILFVTVN